MIAYPPAPGMAFAPVAKAAEKVSESRKLVGLCIALGVVIVLTGVFIACSALLQTPWEPFGDILQWVATITGAHQVSQGASDVSKWRYSTFEQPAGSVQPERFAGVAGEGLGG